MTVIVVPVFNAADEARRCLNAVARTVALDRDVVVIDDASDDPAVGELFADLPERWYRVHNERNIGFVGSANLGMALAGSKDVVLLNADTCVTRGWIEAIERCAESDAGIASITPLTNNGEIVSIPDFCRNNPWPEDPERWAQACREAGRAEYPEVPTAVGFCMFLRRRCLDEIGAFDEPAFGRGYGEENDWCMRSLVAGWRHVICDDAYVAHAGGASFGPLGLEPGGKAMEILLQRYPDYMDRVTAFIETDPMASRRRAIIERFNQLAETEERGTSE